MRTFERLSPLLARLAKVGEPLLSIVEALQADRHDTSPHFERALEDPYDFASSPRHFSSPPRILEQCVFDCRSGSCNPSERQT